MIFIQLSPDDLSRIRFAYSPLMETIMCYWALFDQKSRHWHFQNIKAVGHALLAEHELPYFAALVPDGRFTADFFTAPPTSPTSTFEAELQRLATTDPDIIRNEIEWINRWTGSTPIRDHFLSDPHAALLKLIPEVRLFWRRVVEPHWSRISRVLEQDVMFRGRQTALYGIDDMLANLNSTLTYRSFEMHIPRSYYDKSNYTFHSLGEGITLVPSFFKDVDCLSWQLSDHWQPMLIYGARGVAQQAEPDAEPEEALELTIGASKSRVLQALAEPATTSDLALRLHLTAGAVSQHLGRLQQAALVESHRAGNYVYYQLSARGEKLLRVFME